MVRVVAVTGNYWEWRGLRLCAVILQALVLVLVSSSSGQCLSSLYPRAEDRISLEKFLEGLTELGAAARDPSVFVVGRLVET